MLWLVNGLCFALSLAVFALKIKDRQGTSAFSANTQVSHGRGRRQRRLQCGDRQTERLPQEMPPTGIAAQGTVACAVFCACFEPECF